jgi:hypothetical protein
MNRKPGTADMLKRIIPPLTVWAVGKLLDQPRVKTAVEKIDHKVYGGARKMRRNSDRAWYAAGAAAIVIGIGLLAKGTRR